MKHDRLIGLQSWVKSVKAIAGKHDLRVSFERGGDTVSIKGKHVTIPVPDNRWTDKDYDNVMYAVDQYGSMWRYGEDAFDEYSELTPDAPIGWLLQEFEQNRIMQEAGVEFKGSQEIMSQGVYNRMNDVVIPKIEEMDPKTKAVMEAVAEASAYWNRGYASSVGALMSEVMKDEGGEDILNKLDAIDFADKLDECKDVKDTLALAKHVFETVWEGDPDEQEQKERDKNKDGGEGEGESLEGENPNSAADGVDGEGTPTYGEKLVCKDGEEPDPDDPKSGCYVITEPDGKEFMLESPETIQLIDFKATPDLKPNTGKIRGWMDHMGTGESISSSMFANRLRRLIMVRSQGYYTHGHKRGKLSNKSIWKLAVDHEVAGEDRMFKRRHENDILDTCVGVLVDYSGSMCGNETVLTYEGTRLLVHSMQVLGVPCQVDMFSTLGRGTHVMTVKHFDERIGDDLLMDRSERAAYQMSGNNDSGAVLVAYDRVRHRPEKRKILLVLSDGQPACGIVEGPAEALQHVVKGIEGEGQVEIMGLGVGPYAAVQHYYTQHVTVSNVEDMPTALIDLIANKMLASNEGE